MNRIVELASLERAYGDINQFDTDPTTVMIADSGKVCLLMMTSGRITHILYDRPNGMSARVTQCYLNVIMLQSSFSN